MEGADAARREREVAALVARGLSNREAAEHLLVAQRTVETHLEHIFAKLGVQTRAEVAAWAARQDLLERSAAAPG
jgi:non-specific serine/threonine protein kinase